MAPDHYPRLRGDVGGTHARFGWRDAPAGPVHSVETLRCAEHPSLGHAMRAYLERHALPAPRGCAIGIANPVTGDVVRMTNHHWAFSVSALAREFALARLAVVNDFTALALALPDLGPEQLLPVGAGRSEPGSPLGVIGPGTGLGVSGLMANREGQRVPISGEGGHVTLAAMDDRESRVIDFLRQRFGHASAERALSGPGLVNLYLALSEGRGLRPEIPSPAEVVARADTDAVCAEAVDVFCALLGSVAGNLALTLGARGGIYLGGGIVPRIAGRLGLSLFRERFEGKGRLRDSLRGIPTWIIRAEVSPALIGASHALDAQMGVTARS